MMVICYAGDVVEYGRRRGERAKAARHVRGGGNRIEKNTLKFYT